MSDPIQYCKLCKRVQRVDFYARGFPSDSAKRKLIKACKANGCPCEPQYRAGIDPELLRRIQS